MTKAIVAAAVIVAGTAAVALAFAFAAALSGPDWSRPPAGYALQTVNGTVEHWVNSAYLRDGRELDRERPEGLVFVREAGGRRLAAEVFVLDHAGESAPNVPNGTWHDHTVCLGPGGLGVPVPGGACPPGTAPTTTPPMLHVWLGGTESIRAAIDPGNFCRL